MRDKQKLTQELIDHLPDEVKVSVDEAMLTWWQNVRKDSGLRLTRIGYDILCNYLKLENYKYNLEPFQLNAKIIIQMDRKFQLPYYIQCEKKIPTALVFFGSKEAMMVNLYGDLKNFLDNYHR